MHFAANSLVGESMTLPLKYYNNNVNGTETLLEVLVETGVKNIVFSSTAATYGEASEMPILETTPTIPTNTYGETKLAIEKMLKWTHQAHDLNYVCLRYFNVAGADASGLIGEAHTTETHLIPLVLQVPLDQRPHITVFGTDYPTPDGTCIRDYIHITDLVDAHILALRFRPCASGKYRNHPHDHRMQRRGCRSRPDPGGLCRGCCGIHYTFRSKERIGHE